MRPRICVVGSSNLDLTFRLPRMPSAGETLLAPGFQLGYGGKGANQAVMAARLGADVRLIARIGSGSFAEGMLANLQAEQIDCSAVIGAAGQQPGIAAIMVDDAAQNAILIHPGANQALSAADIHANQAAILDADFVLAQLETPQEATLAAFHLARSRGVRTLLNPAPALPLLPEVLALTDLCVPNEHELALLVGKPAAELPGDALRLRARGPGMVIVTLGERGALLVTPTETSMIPAPSVAAVDTSGAGDAFIGALAVFLAEGDAPAAAIERANRVAALSVTRPGTQTSFPRRVELE